ncbi:MAG TPA: LCP family protein [Nevskiaceae bacterium]|nr:LCP family protein [Nevskiaceae bacterium]
MNDFRKLSRRAQRKAIDGIINNAPSRPQLGDRPVGRRPMLASNLRTNTRRIDNFKRSEGYHAAPRSRSNVGAAPAPTVPVTAQDDASMLRMTLPTGKGLGRRHKEKGKGKRRHPFRRWALRGTLAMLAIVVILGGLLFTKGYFKLHKVFKGGGNAAALQADVAPSLLKGEGDGRINILLLGKGGQGHEAPDLTDTILVASIDPVNKTASLLSIPRDLWVAAPGAGSSKINAVYANAKYRALNSNPKDTAGADKAGINAAEQTVSKVLGVPIHYYGMVDFKAFQQAVDTVGGIDINVPASAAVTDYMYNEETHRNYYLNVAAGNQHFDGLRALMFVRTRHTSTRGDFDRTERQRLFIAALSEKILSAGTYTNPVKISQLMSAFGDHVALDMSISDAVRLMNIGKGIGASKIESIDLANPASPLVTTGMVNGQSIVRPVAGVGVYDAIQAFVRGKLRDGYLAKENANVTVLNGTALPGLATTKAAELKSYGYNVGTVADAPTHEYKKTVIVDLTNGKDKYTKNYLEKRFNVSATKKLPDASIQAGTANFVIILGQDTQ